MKGLAFASSEVCHIESRNTNVLHGRRMQPVYLDSESIITGRKTSSLAFCRSKQKTAFFFGRKKRFIKMGLTGLEPVQPKRLSDFKSEVSADSTTAPLNAILPHEVAKIKIKQNIRRKFSADV